MMSVAEWATDTAQDLNWPAFCRFQAGKATDGDLLYLGEKGLISIDPSPTRAGSRVLTHVAWSRLGHDKRLDALAELMPVEHWDMTAGLPEKLDQLIRQTCEGREFHVFVSLDSRGRVLLSLCVYPVMSVALTPYTDLRKASVDAMDRLMQVTAPMRRDLL